MAAHSSIEMDIDETSHTKYDSEVAVPFEPTGKKLGGGTFGRVIEVKKKDTDAVYAAKELRLEKTVFQPLRKALFEVRSLKILHDAGDHRHLIKHIDSYQFGTSFFIITSPVASHSFQNVLEPAHYDDFEPDDRRKILISAPGCLISAMNFLDAQGISHGDIKADNIVVKDCRVIIIDFGMAMEINTNPEGPRQLQCGIKRPKSCALDIWTLGYVFIQIATILHGILMKDFRDATMQNFANSDGELLKWLWYLWAWYNSCPDGRYIHMAITDLSFFMMDPDSFNRITAPQLVKIVAQQYKVVKNVCCEGCRKNWNTNEEGTPFATFKADRFAKMKKGAFPEDAMNLSVPQDWESANRKWLAQYIHWGVSKEKGTKAVAGKGKGKEKMERVDDEEAEQMIEEGVRKMRMWE